MVYYFIISEKKIFLFRWPESMDNFCKTAKMEEYYGRQYTNFLCTSMGIMKRRNSAKYWL